MFRFFDYILLWTFAIACLILAIYHPDTLLHFFDVIGGAILKLVHLMISYIHNAVQSDFPKQP